MIASENLMPALGGKVGDRPAQVIWRSLIRRMPKVGRGLFSDTNRYSHYEWRLEWLNGTLQAILGLSMAYLWDQKGIIPYPVFRDSKGGHGDIDDL